MFWEAFAASSRIDELLSGPDLTIKELLDDDDLLQKCREKDQRLIDFLSRPDNLDYLLDLVSRTPVSNVFDHNLYRYPSLACEILTNDIDEILDGIIESQSIIDDKPVENSFSHQHHHNNNVDGDDSGNNNIMESTGISSSSPSTAAAMFHENDKSVNMSVISNHDDNVNNSTMELCNLTSTDDNDTTTNNNRSSSNDVNNLSTSMSFTDESSLNNSSSSSYSSSSTATTNTIVNNNTEDKSINNNTLDHHVNTLNSSTDILSSSSVFNGEMKTPSPPATTKTMDVAATMSMKATSSGIHRPRLDKLIQFFNSNQSVNPLSASFVSRLLIHLTLYRGSVVIPYLRSSQDFLNKVFSCLESCAVADLIIQLAQQETKQQCIVFEWFKTDRVVERLIEKFDPVYSFEMHESAAHCLIELITVLRNYLINNPLNAERVNFSLGTSNATTPNGVGSSDDLLADSTTTNPKATNNPNYFNNNNTTQLTSSISGLPVNSSYSTHLFDDFMDGDDDATYKAAENLLNTLESEETMSMLLNRILSNEQQIVTSSIVVNCVNVFMAVMDKRKPESGFPVEGGGGAGGENAEIGSIGFGIPGPINNDISCTNKKTTTNTPNDSAVMMTNGDDDVGNKSSNDCDTSSINNRQQQQQQQPIDKQHILKACENLSKACLSRLSELHKLLKTFHPQFYNSMSTTNGILNPPLGRCRLAVVQLIAALTSLPMNIQLIKAIVANGFVKTLMELFEQYPSNTFLHHSVVDVLTSLFKHSGITSTIKTTTTATNGGNGNASDTSNPNSSTTNKTNQIDDNQTPSSTTPDSSFFFFFTICCSTDPAKDVNCTSDSHQVTTTTTAPVMTNTTHFDEFNSILISLIKDHHIIDWCLRLSPLPAKNDRPSVPYSPNSSLVRLSKSKPKPGYAGHIWQIANLIDSAMNNNSNNGSRGEFVKSIFQDLDSKVKDAWSEFVKEDLSVINSMQVVEDLSESSSISQEGGLLRLITQYNLNKLLSNSSDLLSLAAGGLNLSKTPFVLAPISSLNLMQHKLSDLNGDIRGSIAVAPTEPKQKQRKQLDNQSPFTLLPIQPSSDILITERNSVGGGVSSCSLSDLWLDPDDMEVDGDGRGEQSEQSDQPAASTLHRFTSKSFRQINLCVKNDDNDDEEATGNDDGDDLETTSKVNHHRSLRHRRSSSGSDPMSDDEGCEEEKTHDVEDEGEVDDENVDVDDEDEEEEDLKSPIQIKQQHSSKLTNSSYLPSGILLKGNPLLKGNEEFCDFDILRKPIEELKISESIKQISNTKIDSNPWSDETNQSTGTDDEWADFKKANPLASMTTSHQSDSNESSCKWANFDNISSDNKNNNNNNNNSEVAYPGTLNGITRGELTTGSTNTVIITTTTTTTTTTPMVTPSTETTTTTTTHTTDNIVSSDNSISTTKCSTYHLLLKSHCKANPMKPPHLCLSKLVVVVLPRRRQLLSHHLFYLLFSMQISSKNEQNTHMYYI
ncbi:unnamed protein product [Trichobilharzia szidati]|nr:unnamed protein product [Trichobilharzia szidati]